MQIQYFGFTSFRIQTKLATVITDPFDRKTGLTPPRGSADILVLGEKNNTLVTAKSGISGSPFLVEDPGEYDIKGVTITGIPLKHEKGFVTVYLLESEDIKILNLTHIKQFSMKEEELESLGEIDILIVPVGGGEYMSASDAAKVVNEIEPRIVIPSLYATEGLSVEAEKLDKFVKEMGGKSEEMEKLVLKKKDLVFEETKLIILQPLR